MVHLFEDPHESPLGMFLMQVFITLIVCKILAKLLSFIRQPQVIGQIIAGIIFGPSILGKPKENLRCIRDKFHFRKYSRMERCHLA